MSRRAVELLQLPSNDDANYEPMFVMDVGCGSAITGDVLTEMGHVWVGLDISPHMLNVAVEREVEGDMFLQDMGQGVSFRIGVFDACISISALQWLCNADVKSHEPHKRLARFFASLYRCLKKGGRAVFQLYPETPSQMEMITNCAMKAGFGGGLVVDYPHSTRAKKYFLVLQAGLPNNAPMAIPNALDGAEETTVKYTAPVKDRKKGEHRPLFKSREWIIQRKDRDVRRGNDVKATTKYTGRKRSKK